MHAAPLHCLAQFFMRDAFNIKVPVILGIKAQWIATFNAQENR
jgi:xanthine/uracil permease